MKSWTRFAMLAALTLLVAAPIAPVASAQPAPTNPPTTLKPPSWQAGVGPEDDVVHSWALAPAVGDSAQGADRPNLSYELAAGADVTDKVTLYNFSNVQLTFRLYATDAFNNRDGAFDLLPFDKKPADVGTWVKMPQDIITVPARQQATMPITLKVPITASPGDHAGAVLASSQAVGTGPDGKTITLDRRTGSRVYVRVAGPLTPKLAVEKLHISYKPSLNPFAGSATVTYRVQNRGNTRLAGRQNLSVSGPFGLGTKGQPASDLPELLPGEGVPFTATFHGVWATFISLARVRLNPSAVGGGASGARVSTRALALAIPFTVLVMCVVVWLLARVWNSYRRRRDEPVEAGLLVR